MLDLFWYQYLLIGLIFTWGGFVRTGLGFGGALFTLPLLLLVDNRPLVYLPLIGAQLLFFTSITFVQTSLENKAKGRQLKILGTVDWLFLRKSLAIMIVPKLIGVFGLLTLPTHIMSTIIFSIVIAYSFSYILNRPFKSKNKLAEWLFLMLGGYISGTSLIGAPLIVAVFARHVEKHRLRDTLFALWFILVTIKMSVFVYSGVDLQMENHLWLLPCAGVGHFIGLKAHDYLMNTETRVFYRVIGIALLVISIIGLGVSLLT